MNEFLNNHQTDSDNDEWEKTIQKNMQDLIGHFNQQEKPESTPHPQYEYRATDIKDVIENAEQYIIPECLEVCKALWSKNIETIMCANYNDNDDLFIDLLNDGLSDENKEIFIRNEGKGFRLGDEHDDPYIYASGQTSESAAALTALVDKLKIQDVRNNRFQSSEEFLEEYKYGDMPVEYTGEVDEYGNALVDRQYIPERANATLQDALIQTGKTNLYIPSENRVYESQMFLDWHNRYLKEKNLL